MTKTSQPRDVAIPYQAASNEAVLELASQGHRFHAFKALVMMDDSIVSIETFEQVMGPKWWRNSLTDVKLIIAGMKAVPFVKPEKKVVVKKGRKKKRQGRQGNGPLG